MTNIYVLSLCVFSFQSLSSARILSSSFTSISVACRKPILGVLESGSEVRCLIEDTQGGLCCEPGEYDKVEENIHWFIESILSNIVHGKNKSSAGDKIKKPEVVQTVDECMFFVQTDIIKKFPFSNINGWHMYAVELCLQLSCEALKI